MPGLVYFKEDISQNCCTGVAGRERSTSNNNQGGKRYPYYYLIYRSLILVLTATQIE